jgi:hypothetical protein
MLAVEVIERPVPQPNLWTKGVNNVRQRVGEAFGRALQPSAPETQLDFNPIPPGPVMSFVFAQAGEHIFRQVFDAMFIDSKPPRRLEDNFTLQMHLGNVEYFAEQVRGNEKDAFRTLSDLMAMASMRKEYVENGIPDLLNRDFPTPESIADGVAAIHQEDIDLNRGKGYVFYGNKLPMTDIAWFRRWFHDGADTDKTIIGTVTFTPREEELQKSA